MAGSRVKGQECTLSVTVDGTGQSAVFAAVRNHDFTYELEIKDEGYLGETTNRKDSVFKGLNGSMELHLEGPEIFTFIDLIVNKARRRGGVGANTRVNIQTNINFPSGRRCRVLIPNVEFGEVPLSDPGRTEYLNIKLSYAASEARTISA